MLSKIKCKFIILLPFMLIEVQSQFLKAGEESRVQLLTASMVPHLIEGLVAQSGFAS